jgi:hypothetical protein
MGISQWPGAIQPPPGVTANVDNPPENRNVLIYTIFGICLSISTISVAVKLWTRFIATKRHGWEDYLLIVGWAFAVVYFQMLPMEIPFGAGVHLWNIAPERFMTFQMRNSITDVFYAITMMFIKLSIVFQIYNIFVPNRASPLYYILVITGIITTCFYTACFLYRLFACVPRGKMWNPSIPGHCIDTRAGLLASNIFNMVFDFFFLILPISSIWKLRMADGKKWGLSLIFAVGLLACIASIFRIETSIFLLNSPDETWNLAPVGAWCDAEITCGILCCCLPTFPQFHRLNIKPLVSSFRSTQTHPISAQSTRTQIQADNSKRFWWGSRSQKRDFVELEEWANGAALGTGLVGKDFEVIREVDITASGDADREVDVEYGRIMKAIRVESTVERRVI